MLNKFIKSIFILLLAEIIFCNLCFATTGTVTGANVRIRKGPSTNESEISVATTNEKVDVIGEEGNWYKVNFENITGYISKDYVDTDYSNSSSVEENTNTSSENVVSNEIVTENQVVNTINNEESGATSVSETKYTEGQIVTFSKDTSLRYLPNFSSREHTKVNSGEKYTVKNSLNNWIKVSNDTNSGWVLKTTLEGNFSETNSSETGSVDSSTGSENTDNTSNSNLSTDSNDSSDNAESSKKAKVLVESARVRSKPDGDVLGSLDEGTIVTILSEDGTWSKIDTEEFGECYIAQRLIKDL